PATKMSLYRPTSGPFRLLFVGDDVGNQHRDRTRVSTADRTRACVIATKSPRCIYESVRFQGNVVGELVLSGESSHEHKVLPIYPRDILRRVCLQYAPR